MAISGTLGSSLFISTTAVTDDIEDIGEAAYAALSYEEVGLIESFGNFGRVFDPVNFQPVGNGRMYKLKGGYNEGQMQFVLGQDLSDAGQALLKAAANETTQNNYAFKITFNDAPNSAGAPSIVYMRGLAMSYQSQLGAVNTVIKAQATIEVNSPILSIGAAYLYDLFPTGEALTPYFLGNGSDTEAVDPVVATNALSLVSGDASAGSFAANGSEAIHNTGKTLSNGAITIEADVKISAITGVYAFFGLTDQHTTLEAPIESAASADTLTSNATDAVGFMFDTSMSTDNIWLVGVNGDADETAQNTAVAFVADTYKRLRIEVESDGDATFYIDGEPIGTVMATAVATNVALYPVLAVSARGTTSRTMTVDNLYARQD